MRRSNAGTNLVTIRERRMWTQVELAEAARVSPTTVSGIESGRISRPHFGTLRRLARALEVEPEELLLPPPERSGGYRLSLEWAMSSGEEEFERKLESASPDGLRALLAQLEEEHERLRNFYGELHADSEQRRAVKRQIRRIAANTGSVEATLLSLPDTAPERPEAAAHRRA